MACSKVLVLKGYRKNQFHRFLIYFFELIELKNIHLLRKADESINEFTAVKDKQNYYIRIISFSDKLDNNLMESILKMKSSFNYSNVLIVSFIELDKDFKNYITQNNFEVIDHNKVEELLSQKFQTCTEFIEYMDASKIRLVYKGTINELVTEYYRIKDLLGKGFVSGQDVNKNGKYNWLLYRERFGTWKNFLEEIGEDTDRFKEITADDLINTYHSIKKSLKKKALTYDDFMDNSTYSEHPINRLFGTWINFVKSIEGYHSTSNFSEDDLINEYKRLQKKLNKDVIKIRDFEKYGKFSAGVIGWRYGALTKFRKIHFPEKEKFGNIDDDELIAEYNRVKSILKKEKITSTDINKHGKYSHNKYCYSFGSWLKFTKIMKGEISQKNVSEEFLINDYLEVKKSLNKKILSIRDIKVKCKYPPYIYKLKFGSLKNFYEKVGDDKIFYNQITKEDLINEYIRIQKILNKEKITEKEFNSQSKYSHKPVRNILGSWNNLVKAAGLEVFKYHISTEDLIEEYYRVKKEFKKEYISKEFMNKHGKISSPTFIHRFGTWGKFLESLGESLDYLAAKKKEKEDEKNENPILTFLI